MAMRPIMSSVTLVALILTFLFVGCAKEEPPPPTVEAQPRPAAPPPPPPAPPPLPLDRQLASRRFKSSRIRILISILISTTCALMLGPSSIGNLPF